MARPGTGRAHTCRAGPVESPASPASPVSFVSFVSVMGVVMVAVIVALTAGCRSDPAVAPAAPSPPRVVVTTDVLGDVARNVLGDQVEIETLLPTSTDPSTFHRSDTQLRSIEGAQLIVAVGLGWEVTVTAPIEAARRHGTPVLEVAPLLNPIPVGGTELAPTPPVDMAPDPRVWLDPDRMSRSARLLADEAIRLPGVDAAKVTARLADYQAQIARADEQIQGLIAPVPEPRRTFVTARDSMGYFADRYGFTIAGVLQPDPPDRPAAPGVPAFPNAPGSLVSRSLVDPEAEAAHVRSVVATMRADHIPVIVTDRNDPRVALDVAVGALGPGPTPVVTLDLDALGPAGSGADTYLGLITTNARSLVEALKGG
jgi:zinc/manganese transport system substrate-binding protein